MFLAIILKKAGSNLRVLAPDISNFVLHHLQHIIDYFVYLVSAGQVTSTQMEENKTTMSDGSNTDEASQQGLMTPPPAAQPQTQRRQKGQLFRPYFVTECSSMVDVMFHGSTLTYFRSACV